MSAATGTAYDRNALVIPKSSSTDRHDHTAPHQHHHGHAHIHRRMSNQTMGLSVAATVGFVAVEALAGWYAHSLALWSDAGHNLADAAALGLSWYALSMSRKPSHHGMTFGYQRVGILAALVNALSLVVIALGIGWE